MRRERRSRRALATQACVLLAELVTRVKLSTLNNLSYEYDTDFVLLEEKHLFTIQVLLPNQSSND